jgi:hypothetical protein
MPRSAARLPAMCKNEQHRNPLLKLAEDLDVQKRTVQIVCGSNRNVTEQLFATAIVFGDLVRHHHQGHGQIYTACIRFFDV